MKEYGFNERTFVNKFISCLTTEICNLIKSDQTDVQNLKNIIFEIIRIDNFKVNFNYYDVIKMIIISNISCNSSSSLKQKKEVLSDVRDEINTDESVLSFDEDDKKNISQEINEEKTNNNLHVVNNDEIVKIRINNSFADANKKMKSELEKNKELLLERIKNDSNLYLLMIDAEVGVVSPTNILFVCDTDASAELLNENSNKICEYLEIEKKIVFVDKTRWNSLVNEYKSNLNNKIKYKYIEEPNIDEPVSEIENIANDIFGNDNIIVEE